mmetsp:Transcript_41376/g.99092  ORF Transcript_41376/g.99092 Transcript_41376/m.99092 type:complete len:211 (-) Transcript_41376:1662-2294(-)
MFDDTSDTEFCDRTSKDAGESRESKGRVLVRMRSSWWGVCVLHLVRFRNFAFLGVVASFLSIVHQVLEDRIDACVRRLAPLKVFQQIVVVVVVVVVFVVIVIVVGQFHEFCQHVRFGHKNFCRGKFRLGFFVEFRWIEFDRTTRTRQGFVHYDIDRQWENLLDVDVLDAVLTFAAGRSRGSISSSSTYTYLGLCQCRTDIRDGCKDGDDR